MADLSESGGFDYLVGYGWVILVLVFVGVMLWQFGVFDAPTAAVVATGFVRVKPQITVTELDGEGNFIGSFTNLNGGKMNVLDVRIRNIRDDIECVAKATPSLIRRAELFQITAKDCTGERHNPGEPYELDIGIEYEMTVVGVKAQHTASGRLTGRYT